MLSLNENVKNREAILFSLTRYKLKFIFLIDLFTLELQRQLNAVEDKSTQLQEDKSKLVKWLIYLHISVIMNICLILFLSFSFLHFKEQFETLYD